MLKKAKSVFQSLTPKRNGKHACPHIRGCPHAAPHTCAAIQTPLLHVDYAWMRRRCINACLGIADRHPVSTLHAYIIVHQRLLLPNSSTFPGIRIPYGIYIHAHIGYTCGGVHACMRACMHAVCNRLEDLAALFDLADINRHGAVDSLMLAGALKSVGLLDKTQRAIRVAQLMSMLDGGDG